MSREMERLLKRVTTVILEEGIPIIIGYLGRIWTKKSSNI